MSTPLISPATLGDLIKRESDPDYTRETVTLKAGTAYPLGAVLGRITATGGYPTPSVDAGNLVALPDRCGDCLRLDARRCTCRFPTRLDPGGRP